MGRIRLLHHIWLLLLLVLTACAPGTSVQPNQAAKTIEWTDCQLSAPGIQARMAARCGSLSVYEDRQAGMGRVIELNIAIIPAISRNPAPDPLFFLTGGPGQAATESYLTLSFAFDRINQKREIVLVDQRGTGKSSPLVCDSEQGDSLDVEGEAIIPWLQSCLAAISARPELYTTAIAMEDLDQVREALGYPSINLYGLSYGSRAALTYLANYPEHVRTVILDGVLPQDEVLGLEVAQDAQRALDLIFDRCAAEEACGLAFPKLRQEFQELLANLKDNPATVSISHPLTGEKTEVEFTPEEFSTAVRLLSYAPETAALLPLLIHTTKESRDFSVMAAQYLIVAGQISDSISNGMGFSVLCAEDVPFMTKEDAASHNANTYIGNAQSDELFRVCQVWPKGAIPAEFKQPVSSDRPVLVLSGEIDPVTPPSNGEKVIRTLSNSLHLVIPGQGHNVIYRGCVPKIANSFIEQGNLDGLDIECINQIAPMHFFLNFSGPMP